GTRVETESPSNNQVPHSCQPRKGVRNSSKPSGHLHDERDPGDRKEDGAPQYNPLAPRRIARGPCRDEEHGRVSGHDRREHRRDVGEEGVPKEPVSQSEVEEPTGPLRESEPDGREAHEETYDGENVRDGGGGGLRRSPHRQTQEHPREPVDPDRRETQDERARP